MRKLLICTLCFLSLSWSQNPDKLLDQAEKAFINRQFTQAGQLFFKAAVEKHQVKYRYRSAVAYLLASGKQSLVQARSHMDTLMLQLEPENPLYYQTLLIRAWSDYLEGYPLRAVRRLKAASAWSPAQPDARSLWFCEQIYTAAKMPQPADSCKKKTQAFQYAPETLFQTPQISGKSKPSITSTNVEVKTKKPKVKAVYGVSGKTWALQLGAYSSESSAQALIKRLPAMKRPAQVVPLKRDNGNFLYLVRIFGFNSKEMAQEYGEKHLKPQNFDFQARKLGQ